MGTLHFGYYVSMVSDVSKIAITIFVTVVVMVALPLICGYHFNLGYLCYKYS